MSNQSIIASLQKKFDLKFNPDSLPLLQVIVSEVDHHTTIGCESLLINVKRIREGVCVLVVVGYSHATGLHGAASKATTWGYIPTSQLCVHSHTSFVDRDGNTQPYFTRGSSGSASMRLFGPELSPSPPFGMKLDYTLACHSSFCWYKRIALEGELEIDNFNECLFGRIDLYKRVLSFDKNRDDWSTTQDDISSEAAVKSDNWSVAGVVLAMLKTSRPDYESHKDLVKLWHNLENKLADLRFTSMHPSSYYATFLQAIVTRFEVSGIQHSNKALFEKLVHWRPLANTFYSTDMLNAVPLIKCRSCVLSMGVAYFTCTELVQIAKYKFSGHCTMMYERFKADVSLSEQRISPIVMRTLRKVTQMLSVLYDQVYGSFVNSQPMRTSMNMTQNQHAIPLCVAQARKLVEQGTRMTHIKNDGRLFYLQYLHFMGWSQSQIIAHWSPRLPVIYENSSSALRQIQSTMVYIGKMQSPYSCGWCMKKKLCPYVDKTSNWGEAKQACLGTVKTSAVVTQQGKQLKRSVEYDSPVQYSRLAVS